MGLTHAVQAVPSLTLSLAQKTYLKVGNHAVR